ncbi:transposable element Tcb2 transposase [Trichonephila clavipes]|nr:transposable element Tcb2 transposase [Trichonephila clavipes]
MCPNSGSSRCSRISCCLEFKAKAQRAAHESCDPSEFPIGFLDNTFATKFWTPDRCSHSMLNSENLSAHLIIRLDKFFAFDLEPFLVTGSAGRRPGQGRRRATTPNEDRYLVLTAWRHRNMNATLLQQHLRSATGTHGFNSDCPKPAPWFRSLCSPTDAIGDDFIYMDDNCRPHHANMVEDFLFKEGIVRMEWPACSPNMNPTEHVWDALGRRVAGRQPPHKLSKNWKSRTEYPNS